MKYNILMLLALGLLASCKAPPISELLKDGVDCKAAITMPNVRPGETVDVSVRIYNCHDVSPKKILGE